jgi:hypothetical protein
VTEQQTTALDKQSYQLEVTRPVWLPYNDIAHDLVAALVDLFGYPTSGPKAQKYAVVVASLLKASQAYVSSTSNDLSHYVGIQRRASAWSRYPLVGRTVSDAVVNDFLGHFGGKLVKGSATSGLHKDDQGNWRTDPKMSMYTLDLDKLPKQLSAARFIEVGRPLVKVNKAETRQQKNRRKTQKLAKPFLNGKAAKGVAEDALKASENRIQCLNDFWVKHPLVLPNGHAAASATRVFHDSRFDAGGRISGGWTGLDQKSKRLHCTIDGEPVVEIDIRASQPTLLSSLLGYKMGGLGPNGEWDDVYGELSNLVAIHHYWTIVDDKTDQIELIKRNRNVAKGVVMALIGSGLPLKSKATTELVKDFGLTPTGWLLFRDKLVETIPALNDLEPRYDQKGQLEGYINGAGFLSHHESEMTLRTVEALIEQDVPAYSVHDSLIVKVGDAVVAAKVFRQTIHDYCKQLSGLEVLVPLSVTVDVDTPNELLPSENDLKGRYLS